MRCVLDTNVASESRKAIPGASVRAWWDTQIADDLFITATVLSELLLGVELLSPGRKRDELASWAEFVLTDTFRGRILPIDERAARVYARLVAQARRVGRAAGVADAQIAAVALEHGMPVATRDVAGFSAFGVTLLDPWSSTA